jgi:hypothetical protein
MDHEHAHVPLGELDDPLREVAADETVPAGH